MTNQQKIEEIVDEILRNPDAYSPHGISRRIIDENYIKRELSLRVMPRMKWEEACLICRDIHADWLGWTYGKTKILLKYLGFEPEEEEK